MKTLLLLFGVILLIAKFASFKTMFSTLGSHEKRVAKLKDSINQFVLKLKEIGHSEEVGKGIALVVLTDHPGL